MHIFKYEMDITGKYIGDVRPSLMAVHSLKSISK